MDRDEIARNVSEIHTRMRGAAERAGRRAEEISLVAVSKTFPLEFLEAAFAAGQRIFGENYVQEAVSKRDALPAAEFHMIGHLQRNKVKQIVGKFALIHTVDRLELAQEISKVAASSGVTQRILVQVNISGEEAKSGVDPDEAASLAREILKLQSLSLEGLMCIGLFVEDDAPDAERRKEFQDLAALKRSVEHSVGRQFPHLSMGMSHDFELAIEEGATLVRVGSALFGKREKKQDNPV